MPKGFYKRKLRQGYIDDAGIGHIPLTRSMWALCDAHWWHYLSQWNWHAKYDAKNGRWYAQRYLPNGKQTMHRAVMGEPEGMEIDHIDRSPEGGLDNREENLRIATHAQNGCNSKLRTDNSSGFKGIYFENRVGRWRAQISHNGKRIFLGYFDTREAAAQAYNEAALRYHKKFAVLNPLPQAQITA